MKISVIGTGYVGLFTGTCLAETGIFGLLLLLSMVLVLFLGVLNSKNFLYMMFSVTIAFVFFTESLLYRQSGLFLFIVFYCLPNRTTLQNKLSLIK